MIFIERSCGFAAVLILLLSASSFTDANQLCSNNDWQKDKEAIVYSLHNLVFFRQVDPKEVVIDGQKIKADVDEQKGLLNDSFSHVVVHPLRNDRALIVWQRTKKGGKCVTHALLHKFEGASYAIDLSKVEDAVPFVHRTLDKECGCRLLVEDTVVCREDCFQLKMVSPTKLEARRIKCNQKNLTVVDMFEETFNQCNGERTTSYDQYFDSWSVETAGSNKWNYKWNVQNSTCTFLEENTGVTFNGFIHSLQCEHYPKNLTDYFTYEGSSGQDRIESKGVRSTAGTLALSLFFTVFYGIFAS